jgi:hypothetical protein
MKKNKQVTPAPDWAAIFKRRPALVPPGYLETCALIKQQKEQTNA